MNIQDKVVIVTGGASGLGLAACRVLAAKGAKVVAYDMNEAAGAAMQAEFGEQGHFCSVNVTSEESVKAAIAETVEKFGTIHACINCAGVAFGGRTVGRNGALALDKFAQVININLIGTFNVLRLAAEQMSKNTADEGGECGVIINTASVAAFDGQVGQAAYAASKAGVAGMTLPIARDFSKLGIRVMTIAPGIFNTPMMEGMTDEVKEPLIQMVQSPKRLGQPEEYGQLAAHIIENGYLNGETIRLDAAIRMEPK